MGIEVPIAATVLGAKVIEKHFTLDRSLPGPDHMASLNPAELKAMVQGIRNVTLAISGSGNKEPTDAEKVNIYAARKSIHMRKSIKKGDVINRDHLIMLRPGDGISPMQIDSVIGRRVKADIEEMEQLKLINLE